MMLSKTPCENKVIADLMKIQYFPEALFLLRGLWVIREVYIIAAVVSVVVTCMCIANRLLVKMQLLKEFDLNGLLTMAQFLNEYPCTVQVVGNI